MYYSFQQRQLKKKFLVENHFRKGDRVLPRFGGMIDSFLDDSDVGLHNVVTSKYKTFYPRKKKKNDS